MRMYVYAWNYDEIQQRNLVMTLTKAHIVEALAEQNGYPKRQSFDTIETLLEIIKRTLESGEDVLVSRFGKFCVKDKRERRKYDGGAATGCDIQMFREVME
jgi:integration host factor subunit alpha